MNDNFARQISCIAAFCRRKCRTIAKNTKKLFRAANRGNIGCSRLFLEREVGEGSIDILLLGLENFAGEKESCHENYSHLSFKPSCLWHYPKFSYFRTTALTTCQSSIVTIVTPISHTTLQGNCNPMNSEIVNKSTNYFSTVCERLTARAESTKRMLSSITRSGWKIRLAPSLFVFDHVCTNPNFRLSP